MKAIISLAVPKEELEEQQREFEECNDRKMTEQELKDMYVDWFLADKNDYIYPDEISVHFV
jgi:hypothetical protein